MHGKGGCIAEKLKLRMLIRIVYKDKADCYNDDNVLSL